jgi:hypothetical protein
VLANRVDGCHADSGSAVCAQHGEVTGSQTSSSPPRRFTSRWPRCAERSGFPKGAQLLLVHAGKAEPLVTGFAATADANVSFDGKTVLFAASKARAIPGRFGN